MPPGLRFAIVCLLVLLRASSIRLIHTRAIRASYKMASTLFASAPDSSVEIVEARANPFAFSLQQTMLRIKDPNATLSFYTENFGFRLMHKYTFPQYGFDLLFLAIPPADDRVEEWPEPGTKESEAKLWTLGYSTLEFTYNYASEDLNNGNVEPHRGFGHIAVMTPDIYSACADLEAAGCQFQKKPDDGKMKGIAFVLDPDKYWIEIIPRSASSVVSASTKFTLAQTMKRIKDPVKSLHFYRDLLGMSLLRVAHYGDFSNYFLAHLPPGTKYPAPDSAEASEFIRSMFPQVLELTHNHGTEDDPEFSYHNGNDQDTGQKRGFGHIGYLCNDLDAACTWLQSENVAFKKLPHEGSMRGLAFAYDDDGYWVELIQSGGLKMIP